jgi:hypothetical protein
MKVPYPLMPNVKAQSSNESQISKPIISSFWNFDINLAFGF